MRTLPSFAGLLHDGDHARSKVISSPLRRPAEPATPRTSGVSPAATRRGWSERPGPGPLLRRHPSERPRRNAREQTQTPGFMRAEEGPVGFRANWLRLCSDNPVAREKSRATGLGAVRFGSDSRLACYQAEGPIRPKWRRQREVEMLRGAR